MKDIAFERRNVNVEALHADLVAVLGSMSNGVSTGPFGVIVHLNDQVTPAQITQVRTIVESHDPSRLTAKQQAEIDRKTKLDQARQDYRGGEIDLSTYSGQNAIIQKLAQKILWLEREIADLRGG